MAFCKQMGCPKNAVRIQTTIRSKTHHTNLRAKRIVVDNLIVLFFGRGKGKAKLIEDGAQEKLYEYINSNSLQSLITQICARSKSLLILWNFLKIGVANFFEDATHRLSNILPMAFRTYRPWPLAHTPARNICGRSKLWCWRHRCTVRGSTLGAVYTSFNLF